MRDQVAKKKKQKKKLDANIMALGVIIILILGAVGIQVPEVVQDYFGTSKVAVEQTQPKPPKEGENPGPINHGLAVFTKEELKDGKKGWIKYAPLDSLERAGEANALIKKDMVNTGTKANQNVRPPGFVSGLDPYGHARGHLIGRQFGGSGDDPENLVTLYQNPVNTPLMTKYENMIREAVEDGETVRYRVTPIYDNKNLMCQEVHMEAQGLTADTQINFNVSILNKK